MGAQGRSTKSERKLDFLFIVRLVAISIHLAEQPAFLRLNVIVLNEAIGTIAKIIMVAACCRKPMCNFEFGYALPRLDTDILQLSNKTTP